MKKYFRTLLVFVDAIFLTLAYVGACYLAGYSILNSKVGALAIIWAFQLLVFLRFGFYRAALRYASVDFLFSIVKGVTVAEVVLIVGLYVLHVNLPIQVLVGDWFLTLAFIGGSRFAIRYFYEMRERWQKGKRVLIYGAGDMGVSAFRQLRMSKVVPYSPVGFIDDDPSKKGTVIRGIKVFGGLGDLDAILGNLKIEEVVVAIAEFDSEKLREIVKRCRQKNVVCRMIPCFSKLIQIEPAIRNVELADLMRRAPQDLDKEAIEKYIEQKVVLITGAAGSIGSELVRQCLKFNPKHILALDQSEYGLYSLREELGDSGINYLLCDATNVDSVEKVFATHGPEIVFHAAAYKHVPLLEFNAVEAVINNVGSTKCLCEMADKYHVESFVMISTDKAVKPSSIMGSTKRVCELIVQSFSAKSQTTFVAVRFGNVLGSSGSVIPKFMEQIRNGGPVTVTHPETTRYFMLIDEAVQLVLQAATINEGGKIFILDMGKPVRIVEMAEDLIYLMGRQPHTDIKIKFCGLQSGEKIHEELFTEEIESKTKYQNITIAKASKLNWKELEADIQNLLEKAQQGSVDDCVENLSSLVSFEKCVREISKGDTLPLSLRVPASQEGVLSGRGNLPQTLD